MYELYGRTGSYIYRIDSDRGEIHVVADLLDKVRELLPGVELDVKLHSNQALNAEAGTTFDDRVEVTFPIAQLPVQKEPIDLWLDEVLYNAENPFGIDCGYRLTRLMEGGIKALSEKKTVTF